MMIINHNTHLQNISLFFFLFLFFIFKINSYRITNEILSCEGNDPKKDVCALILRGSDGNGVAKIQIKEECEKDEVCDSGISGNKDQLQCIKIIKAKGIGESCTYKEDCITNICQDSECVALKENDTCSTDFIQCGSGLSCSENREKCVKLAGEGEYCKSYDMSCDFGLECNTADNKCYKIGSLEEGRDCGISENLCKSGLSYNGRCVILQTDGSCVKEFEGIFTCKGLQFKGATYQDDIECTTYIGDDNLEENYVCSINLLKQKLWELYMEEFNDLDLEDYKNEDDYLIERGTIRYTFGKKKLSKYFYLSKYADMFKARGYLDEDGEFNEDKECEGKFLLAALGGNNAGNLRLSFFLLIFVIMAILK